MTDSWHDFLQSQAKADFTGNLAENAIYGLDCYQCIHVHGDDAETFLQGQLSCDVREITESLSGIGSHNNAKGRMLSSFRICRHPQGGYWLRIHYSIIESARAALAKYAVFSKSEINIDDNIGVIGLHGDDAMQRLQKLFPAMPENDYQQSIINNEIVVICTSAKYCAFELYGKADKLMALWPPLTDKLPVHDARQHRLLEHTLGLAFVEQGTHESIIPQMFNYQALPAISFQKGCYTGQEIIARMQYLGKLKRHLYHFRCHCEGKVTAGDQVMHEPDGKECGQVASVVSLPEDKLDILLVLTTDAADAKSLFTASATLHDLQKLPLPYSVEKQSG